MTKKMKKLWFILLLEYFKKQLNYEGFKIVHTINTAVFWSIIPATTLAIMGIGSSSLPLGIGISFCLSSLIMRDDRIQLRYENTKEKIEANIVHIQSIITKDYS